MKVTCLLVVCVAVIAAESVSFTADKKTAHHLQHKLEHAKAHAKALKAKFLKHEKHFKALSHKAEHEVAQAIAAKKKIALAKGKKSENSSQACFQKAPKQSSQNCCPPPQGQGTSQKFQEGS